MKRNGLSLVEVMVAVVIATLVAGLAQGLLVAGVAGSAKTDESAEAVRSVAVALEALRRDLEMMLYQCPARDLAVLDDPVLGPQRGVSLRIPAGRSAGVWGAKFVPVTYRLKALGRSGAHHLVRAVEGEPERELASCLLRDMVVQYLPAGPDGLSRFQAYLDITLIGIGSARARETYAASILVPLALMTPAGAYRVEGK